MKIAMFTDIHFGAKGNSEQHLQDCLNFIDWFCDQAVHANVDAIAFLGDWFESRDAIMLHTLDASHKACIKLNSLNIPIYFITGNHDIKFKTSREISSTSIFSEFSNFTIIKDEILKTTFGKSSVAFAPFFFESEYGINANFLNGVDYVFGHFEFKNFVVTGKTVTLDHGPDHNIFDRPKRIFSGHFHKRQLKDNICYIGNPFATNYGDVMDTERGMCILETDTNTISFLNFDGPNYFYCSLVDLIERVDFPPMSNVKCFVDVDIPYSEIQQIRKEYIEGFSLREFIIEDSFSAAEMAKQDGVAGDDFSMLDTKDTIVKIIDEKLELLNSTINRDRLKNIFLSLKP